MLLSGNAHSPIQAFAYERDGVDFWGVQYHPECTARVVSGWLRSKGDEYQQMADDMARADTDAEAALRLGAKPSDLEVSERTRELANWMRHVEARAGG